MAILTSRERPAARRGALLPIAGVAALTLALAALQPLGSAHPTDVELPSAPKPAGSPALTVKAELVPAPAAPAAAAPRAPEATVPTVGMAAAEPCWQDRGDRDFRGSSSTSERNGVVIVHERVGLRGNDRIVQRVFGDLRVCALAEGLADDDDAPPSAWASRAARLVLETGRPGDLRHMEIAGGRVEWSVNGSPRAVDADAEAWRGRLLEVLDATWELSRLRGRVSSLRGQISSIYGERSSLQGEISSLRGQVSSMRGQISSHRGEESSLRGEISSIRGHESSLRGAISSEHGAISSLVASRLDDATIARRRRVHEEQIRRLEQEIERYDADARVREVERRLAALETDERVAAVERRIREFDVEGRVAAVERRLAGLAVERRVAEIERQIAGLDADRRGRELEARTEQALERLRAVLGRR